jgi:hypothetical protein
MKMDRMPGLSRGLPAEKVLTAGLGQSSAKTFRTAENLCTEYSRSERNFQTPRGLSTERESHPG